MFNNMDMIETVSETQKNHFEEIKEYVGRCLDEIQTLTKERDELKALYIEEKKKREEAQLQRDQVRQNLDQSTEAYIREFNEAKNHWENIEINLKNTCENIQKDLKGFEEHNNILGEKLILIEDQLKNAVKNEENAKNERDLYIKKSDILTCQVVKLKEELVSVSNDLHASKMKLLQQENHNGNIQNELKKYKKATESALNKMTSTIQEKNIMVKNNEDLTQAVLKNKNVETEIKDVKYYLSILGEGNGTINNKLDAILKNLKKESKSIAVQTDLTTKHISEYDSLDREAAILVIKMREELVSTKDELIEIRRENETLKNFVRDFKREREVKDEEERVEKLEEAVRALGDLVTQEQNRPTREETIIRKLTEVKKDLDSMKTQKSDLSSVPIKLTTYRNARR